MFSGGGLAFLVQFYESYFVEARKGELLAHSLQGTLLNARQEDTHIFGARTKLLFCVACLLLHSGAPSGFGAMHDSLRKVDGAGSQV